MSEILADRQTQVDYFHSIPPKALYLTILKVFKAKLFYYYQWTLQNSVLCTHFPYFFLMRNFEKSWILSWATEKCHHFDIRRTYHGNSTSCLPQRDAQLSGQKKSSRCCLLGVWNFSKAFNILSHKSTHSTINEVWAKWSLRWTEDWLSYWAPRAETSSTKSG